MFSRLLRHRRRGSVQALRTPGPAASVTLRLATGDDDDELARLAALYDRPLPSGPLLLAEVDGQLHAALTLTGAQELMEPYLPTAALVELLALRAQHLRDQTTSAELAEAGRMVATSSTPARSSLRGCLPVSTGRVRSASPGRGVARARRKTAQYLWRGGANATANMSRQLHEQPAQPPSPLPEAGCSRPGHRASPSA
jgi:hypothetical protein